MEKGVYDGLQKKYLKTLLFCVCEAAEGPMVEEYAFSFTYSGCDSQEVMMNINRSGSKKQGGMFKCNETEEITPNQMRSSACKMVRTLVQLTRTLDKMPEQRTILMKLLYYDDLTPADYEPPFFRGSTEEKAHNPWTRSPLKMEVGNVNSKHFVLALKVKSVLDPCEDENEDIEDDGVSLGGDSVQRDSSDSDSESDNAQEDQFIVSPAEKPQQQDTPMAEEDDTQDPMEDEHQLARVKDWINNRHLDTIELTDIFSNLPDISVVQTEEIIEKLVKEGVLSKTGGDIYIINRQKHQKFDFEFYMVKEEIDGQVSDKAAQIDDLMYMKVKSVLDPCEDENEDIQDDGVSLSDDSVQRDSSDSDSESDNSQEDQFVVAPAEKPQQQDTPMAEEDDAQDPMEDEHRLSRVKDWINNPHLDTVELTDILSNFSDISVVYVLSEEITEMLVKEGVLSKTGGDTYVINKQKRFNLEFNLVKEEIDYQVGDKAAQIDDLMYMKGLFHALPRNYVNVAKLQSMLEGEVNQISVRKMIDKMVRDGFVQAKGNQRLGKRVILSDKTQKKFMEVKKALKNNVMDVDTNDLPTKTTESNQRDTSTGVLLHSIGSDLTRVKLSNNQNGSIGSEQTMSKAKEPGKTPTSRAETVTSRESFVAVNEKRKANGNNTNCNDNELNGAICSRTNIQNFMALYCSLGVANFQNKLEGKANQNNAQNMIGKMHGFVDNQRLAAVLSSYSGCDSEEIMVNINRNGNKRQGKKTAMEDLPDELLTEIFARTPIRFHRSIGEVSVRWRRIVRHRSIYDIRFQLGITEQVLCLRHRYGFRALSEWYKCDLIMPRRALVTPLPNLQLDNLEMSATVAVGSCIYVIGGMSENETGNHESTQNVWVLDVFRSVEWNPAPAMPRLLMAPKAVVLGHRIFVVGYYRGFYGGLVFDTITRQWNIFRIPEIRRSEPVRNFVAVDGQLFLFVGPFAFVFDQMQQWTRYPDTYFNQTEGNVVNARVRWYQHDRFQTIFVLGGRPLTWRAKDRVILIGRTYTKIVGVGHQLFMLLERKHRGNTEAWLVEIGTDGRRIGRVLRRHCLLRENIPPGDDVLWPGYFEDCTIVGVQG